MGSDDLTALSTISMGALVSAALTFSLAAVAMDAEDDRDRRVEFLHDSRPEAAVCDTGRRVVDYAIIRSDGRGTDVQLTVGPERPAGRRGSAATGSSLEMRLLRSR